MRKRMILRAVTFLALLSFPTYAGPRDGAEVKTFFSAGFPRQLTFRGEYIQSQHVDYAAWAAGNLPAAGVLKKYVQDDEMERTPLETQDWARRFSKEHPETLLLLHWDAQEHRNDKPGSFQHYFAGHWLSLNGSVLTKDAEKESASLEVADLAPFLPRYANTGAYHCPILLVVELDKQGHRLWNTGEYVRLTDVDEKNRRLIVERGQVSSSPRAFPKGAYVAPMATRLGIPGQFLYNWSTLCPRYKGRQAADVLLDELLRLVGPGGSLEFLDGIAFDVLQWEPMNPRIDVNNDGVSDKGWVDGINTFREGTLAFMQRLRQALGDRTILTADSYAKTNQRGLGLFNGLESEGLVKHNDAFRGFSKTINVFTYWSRFSRLEKKVAYLVSKFKNPSDCEADGEGQPRLQRLLVGTAACLGAATTRQQGSQPIDEIRAGADQTDYWLGQPAGEMVRLARQSPDLLNGEGVEMTADFFSRWVAKDCRVSRQGREMKIEGTSPGPAIPGSITWKGFSAGKTGDDLTLYFEIRSLDPLNGMPGEVPRIVSVEVEGLPDYEQVRGNNPMYNDLWGYFGTQGYQILSFYYRNAGARSLNLKIEFEGQGGVLIKNLSVHAHPAALAREFENGVVLANPALKPYSFDLEKLFPGKAYKRILGTGDPEVNNGRPVEGTVAVPALDALFLKRMD